MGRQAVIALGVIAVMIAILFFATQLGRIRPARAAGEFFVASLGTLGTAGATGPTKIITQTASVKMLV
jgi:hypothetical protein